jgi:pectinesterase
LTHTDNSEGGVDWIFGDAAAWFGVCTIAAKQSGGSITANSRTLSTDIGWYVFDTCTVEAASGYSLAGEVYLGRPWRILARVIFQNSVLSNIINAAGWTTLATDATP